MATDKKISELTAATALTGAEILEIVQGGANKQTTTQDIADLGGGAVASVNGQTGVVVLDAGDVGADPAGSASTAQSAAIAAGVAATVGVQDLFIPAAAMWPRVSSGCAPLAQTEIATSFFNIQSLDFDQTVQEFAQFQVRLPRKWNNGTITAAVYWTADSGSGDVQWGISGGAYSNDDPLTIGLGTAQTSTDTLIATNDLHISPTTAAITIGGSPADADFLAIQVARNPASDTLTADAKLLGIVLFLTTDAAIDA